MKIQLPGVKDIADPLVCQVYSQLPRFTVMPKHVDHVDQI